MNARRTSILFTCVVGLTLSNAFAASKPDPVNADFFANPKKIEKVALIVDTFIVEDIRGKVDGIHRSDHDALVPVVGRGVRQAIEDRGYQVTEMQANAGLFASSELKLVYANQADESLGQDVTYPLYPSNVPTWAQGPIQVVMERVFIGVGPRRKPTGSFAIDLPPEIKSLPVDAVVIVTSTVGGRGGGAFVAGGAIGGAIRDSLLTTRAGPQDSMITIVDTRDGTVLWFDEGEPPNPSSAGSRMIRHTLVHLLVKLPKRNATLATTSSVESDPLSATDAAGAATETAPGVELTAKSSTLAPVSFADKPSVFADPNGWSAYEVRRAYRAGAIPAEESKRLRRNLDLEYRRRLEELGEAMRIGQITRHERQIEEHRLEWIYRGFF